MSERDANYYFENPIEYDALSDEQRDTVLNGGILPDDLQGVNESSESPDASDAVVDEEPVILGKSGQHTIPYSALEEARAEAAQYRTQAEQQAELIRQLQEAKATDDLTGGTAAQDAVIEEHEFMFPDIAEDMKPLIQKMIADGIQAGLKEINDKVIPLEQSYQHQAEAEAKALMFTAHPDIIDVLNSDVFNDWALNHPKLIDTKNPNVVIDLQSALDNANPHEVNEVLAQFKQSNTPAPVIASGPSKLDQVKEKLAAGVRQTTPVSFQDVPGAVTAESDVVERMLNMSTTELETAMLTMNEAQRNALFARMA